MQTYFGLSSSRIHEMLFQSIDNGIRGLKKSYWKEGTKPQDKQLAATQQASKELEDIYENYLQYHIKAVRALHYDCPLTKECVNAIQLYRKQGIISLLKKYSPNLGKEVNSPYKPLKTRRVGERTEAYTDVEYGVYERDWNWAKLGLSIYGKVMNENLIYDGVSLLTPDIVERSGGHAYMEKIANQAKFNVTFAMIRKTGRLKKTPLPQPDIIINHDNENVEKSTTKYPMSIEEAQVPIVTSAAAIKGASGYSISYDTSALGTDTTTSNNKWYTFAESNPFPPVGHPVPPVDNPTSHVEKKDNLKSNDQHVSDLYQILDNYNSWKEKNKF